ncbi:hypothetical protein [Thiolinea disciformis]|uniref:hypothetical protein n=1 Tax=Thiolinea disciformis TaxID=125614 RepID=UPI00036B7C52|nr:hypothetical protein [Thiolinea disciformis]
MPLLSNIKSLLVLALFAIALVGCDAGVPEPNLAPAKAKAAQCVEPTADMRKNHMKYLLVHRDKTVIEGIRTTQHSLNECINCHVAPTREDGSAVHYTDEKKDHFCSSCHSYVGVKLDCFQCHADRPQVMENINYQHKLSSNTYHLSAKNAPPELSDLLLLGQSQQAQGVTQ